VRRGRLRAVLPRQPAQPECRAHARFRRIPDGVTDEPLALGGSTREPAFAEGEGERGNGLVTRMALPAGATTVRPNPPCLFPIR